MAWLREWISMVQSGLFSEAIIAACNFESPHQKEFRFLLAFLSAQNLHLPCTRDHPHVKIEGRFTKPSAIYPEALGMHLAVEFKAALRRMAAETDDDLVVAGNESLVVNDVVQTLRWKEVSSWTWKRSPHINVLEVSASVAALHKVGASSPHSCFVSLIDSVVARGALTKGRSTSVLLRPSLLRSAALQIIFDLFPVWRFCPTRLNVADDPTRDVAVRSCVRFSFRGSQVCDLAELHSVGLKRFAANWIRLVLLASAFLPSRALCLDSGASPLDFEGLIPIGLGTYLLDLMGKALFSISTLLCCGSALSLLGLCVLCSLNQQPFWGGRCLAAGMEPMSAAERRRALASSCEAEGGPSGAGWNSSEKTEAPLCVSDVALDVKGVSVFC